MAEEESFGSRLRRGGGLDAAGLRPERDGRQRARSQLAGAASGLRGGVPDASRGQLGAGAQADEQDARAAEPLGIEQRQVEEAPGEVALAEQARDRAARRPVHRAGGALELASA